MSAPSSSSSKSLPPTPQLPRYAPVDALDGKSSAMTGDRCSDRCWFDRGTFDEMWRDSSNYTMIRVRAGREGVIHCVRCGHGITGELSDIINHLVYTPFADADDLRGVLLRAVRYYNYYLQHPKTVVPLSGNTNGLKGAVTMTEINTALPYVASLLNSIANLDGRAPILAQLLFDDRREGQRSDEFKAADGLRNQYIERMIAFVREFDSAPTYLWGSLTRIPNKDPLSLDRVHMIAPSIQWNWWEPNKLPFLTHEWNLIWLLIECGASIDGRHCHGGASVVRSVMHGIIKLLTTVYNPYGIKAAYDHRDPPIARPLSDQPFHDMFIGDVYHLIQYLVNRAGYTIDDESAWTNHGWDSIMGYAIRMRLHTHLIALLVASGFALDIVDQPANSDENRIVRAENKRLKEMTEPELFAWRSKLKVGDQVLGRYQSWSRAHVVKVVHQHPPHAEGPMLRVHLHGTKDSADVKFRAQINRAMPENALLLGQSIDIFGSATRLIGYARGRTPAERVVSHSGADLERDGFAPWDGPALEPAVDRARDVYLNQHRPWIMRVLTTTTKVTDGGGGGLAKELATIIFQYGWGFIVDDDGNGHPELYESDEKISNGTTSSGARRRGPRTVFGRVSVSDARAAIIPPDPPPQPVVPTPAPAAATPYVSEISDIYDWDTQHAQALPTFEAVFGNRR